MSLTTNGAAWYLMRGSGALAVLQGACAGDIAVEEGTFTGTHRGEFAGLPNLRVEYLRVEPPGIPTAFWRSVLLFRAS